MAAAAILDFHILKILTPESSIWPNCVNVPNFVKIGYFSILQDGGAAMLDFQIFVNFNNRTLKRAKLRHCAKFHRNRSHVKQSKLH